MRYGLQETSSLERLLALATGVIAALEAKPETAEQAAPWKELKTQLRGARDARDDDRDAVYAAAARVRVLDAEWDAAVTDLSGRAWLAAGKDARTEPYASLFGSVKASDAVRLGVSKAQAFGARLVARARELGHADLTAAVDRLAAATEALSAAGARRDEASEKALLHDIRRRSLVRAAKDLGDATEVAILTRFPGRRDLVAAVLAAPEEDRRRRAGGAEPSAAPAPTEAPETDREGEG